MHAVKFDLGRVVVTKAIQNKMEIDPMFAYFVKTSVGRFSKGDWGSIGRRDKEKNDTAVKKGGKILGTYRYLRDGSEATVSILAESDRNMTTIMFLEEC